MALAESSVGAAHQQTVWQPLRNLSTAIWWTRMLDMATDKQCLSCGAENAVEREGKPFKSEREVTIVQLMVQAPK